MDNNDRGVKMTNRLSDHHNQGVGVPTIDKQQHQQQHIVPHDTPGSAPGGVANSTTAAAGSSILHVASGPLTPDKSIQDSSRVNSNGAPLTTSQQQALQSQLQLSNSFKQSPRNSAVQIPQQQQQTTLVADHVKSTLKTSNNSNNNNQCNTINTSTSQLQVQPQQTTTTTTTTQQVQSQLNTTVNAYDNQPAGAPAKSAAAGEQQKRATTSALNPFPGADSILRNGIWYTESELAEENFVWNPKYWTIDRIGKWVDDIEFSQPDSGGNSSNTNVASNSNSISNSISSSTGGGGSGLVSNNQSTTTTTTVIAATAAPSSTTTLTTSTHSNNNITNNNSSLLGNVIQHQQQTTS
ncbi:hypothetical protein SAMD00019534_064730 [Acytostelium subglobosum LB1]|uniref:hypothetical protein n=1 Tax=Acytostelium subglobosum LB1 TaxID=1410327 RepID=UPI000644AA40|nr:hypothetical protein SAMD00019534_064730 [Acytostelium subglobosum LB1]GAM23298.1 hypothetical protein SAMD00019534_064730 [Acytostelium subglobosum LB1]|eukprot:XP_012753747.1 hypothetical protein SAMD00019534_064730 [Acytostelium subglobosum LB1]